MLLCAAVVCVSLPTGLRYHLPHESCDTFPCIVFLSEFYSSECLLTTPLFDLSRFMHPHDHFNITFGLFNIIPFQAGLRLLQKHGHLSPLIPRSE